MVPDLCRAVSQVFSTQLNTILITYNPSLTLTHYTMVVPTITISHPRAIPAKFEFNNHYTTYTTHVLDVLLITNQQRSSCTKDLYPLLLLQLHSNLLLPIIAIHRIHAVHH